MVIKNNNEGFTMKLNSENINNKTENSQKVNAKKIYLADSSIKYISIDNELYENTKYKKN